MAAIPVFDVDTLPPFVEATVSGAHGSIVIFEETGAMGKIVRKRQGGMPYEFIMEIVARDRCGNDPSVNFIVPILAVYITPTKLAFSMPYVCGGDMYLLMKDVLDGEVDAPPMDAAYGIVRDFVTAVCLMHGNGMAHRDIKDANVLIKEDGRGSLLCDFSLATVFEHERGSHFVPYTKGYRPPEVMRYSKNKDMQLDFFASDMYATASVVAKFLMVVSGEWLLLDAVPSHRDVLDSRTLDPNTRDMMAWMMRPDPSERPASAEVLARMAWMRPEAYVLPKPFQARAAPSVPADVAALVKRAGLGISVARVAADILGTVEDSPRVSGKRKVLMCVAMAIKVYEATDERETLALGIFTDDDISRFVETVIRSPETISALHRSVDCRPVSAVETAAVDATKASTLSAPRKDGPGKIGGSE